MVDRTINLFWPDMAIRLLSYWCGGGGGRAGGLAGRQPVVFVDIPIYLSIMIYANKYIFLPLV